MFGALIGAGASLLGSLFGGGSKKQQTTTTNHVDYGRMVREAEAAGFNPLTALRNGGAAGFSVSTGTTPATPLSARIADGVSGAAQSFLANFDPFKDQQREAEFKLVEAQLANLQADTALKKVRFGEVPTYAAGTTKKVMGSGVKKGQTFKSMTDVLPDEAGHSQTPKVEQTTVTNPYPIKWGVQVDPNLPDAAAYGERYGDSEIAQMIYGAGTFAGDLWHNSKRKYKMAGHAANAYHGAILKKMGDVGPLSRKSLKDNYHPLGTNIYGLPSGQMPSLSSPRKLKQ